jgi:hypothetical protein
MYLEKIADQMNLAAASGMPTEVLAANWSASNNRMEIQITEGAFAPFCGLGPVTKRLQNNGRYARLSFITSSGAEIFALKEAKVTGPLYQIIDGELVEVGA